MNYIIKRNIRFWFKTSLQMIGIALAAIAGYTVFQMLSISSSQMSIALGTIPLYIAWIGGIMLLAIELATFQTYLPMVLSFGSRRKEAFWGVQLLNLSYIVMTLAAFAITQYFFHDNMIASSGIMLRDIMIVFCAVMLLAGGAGEILGMIVSKLGNKGIIVFVIVCTFIGMVAGFTYATVDNGGIVLKQAISCMSLWGILVIAIIIYVVGAMMAYRTIKNMEVRV